MTEIDSLYITLKTRNAAQAKAEIAAIDKQLDEMDKKGKKRDDKEENEYQLQKKRRKELVDSLKDQQREVDKLGKSFQDMATNAIGAVTAFATFTGIKNALIDVNKLNVGLGVLAGQTGISAKAYRQLGAAIASSTGLSPDASLALAKTLGAGYSASRQAIGLPATTAGFTNYIQTLRNTASQYPKGNLPGSQIRGLPGVVEALPFLQLSPEEYKKANAFGASVSASDADYFAAQKNAAAANKAALTTQNVLTQENTTFSDAVQSFNQAVQSFVGAFKGHPYATLSGLTASSILTGVGTLKLLKYIFGGGAAASGAVTSGETAAGASLASVILGASAIAAGAWYGLGKEQDFINRTFGKKPAIPVPSGTSPTGTSRRAQIQSLFEQMGYSPAAAAGWTANAQAESSFNPAATNGSHFGLFQWSAQRRARILKDFGIDVATASIPDQVRGAALEGQKYYGLSPSAFAGLPSGSSSALISNRFEVPATTSFGLATEAARRAQIAQGYGVPSLASASGGQVMKTFNIKIDDIKIQTAASDAAGIAREVGVELKNQIRIAISNIDDGISA